MNIQVGSRVRIIGPIRGQHQIGIVKSFTRDTKMPTK